MATEVRVIGGRQLRRTLRQAGIDLRELKAINAQAAGVVAQAGRGSAPSRSGRLAASIRPGATQKAGVVRAGRASLPYAGVIHWGWPKRNITAQPFLTDAAAATEGRWSDLYWRELQRVIDSVEGA